MLFRSNASRICLRKHLGSVTEAPRLRFSSQKQFFSPKTAEIHHQGDPGPYNSPLQPIDRKKGEEVAAQLAWLLPPEAIQLQKIIMEGPIQNFEIAICTPSILISSPPSFVIYEKVTESYRT